MPCIIEASIGVLNTADARDKATEGQRVVAAWRDGALAPGGSAMSVPERPGRPDSPALCAPADLPRRRLGTAEGRIALLHAIAHIELNAIDLAFDIVARFSGTVPMGDRQAFVDDWLSVGDDECRHFLMVDDRLRDCGSSYGALPAHDGLWEAATRTADDVLARLAIAPLVLEARGLDVTPQMITNLRKAGDAESAQILSVIYEDEISHVAFGARWLKTLCAQAGHDPQELFQDYVRDRFPGGLKEPFNHDARQRAGFERNFYLNL